MGETALAQVRRPPFYRDAIIVKWVVQVIALLGVLSALFFLATQAGDNLRAKSIPTGYDFLTTNPGFKLSEGIDTDPATGGRALWVGMVNTIRLAIGGIALATVIGVLAGIGRLSGNWLVRRITGAYVEAMRNVPLLVQIFIIAAVLAALPRLTLSQESIDRGLDAESNWLYISNKGLSVPRVYIGEGFYQWMVFVLAGVAAGLFARRVQQRRRDDTGVETYPMASLLAVLAAFAAVGWWLHPVFGWLGGVFGAAASAIGALPPAAVQVAVSMVATGMAVLWIRRQVDAKRTPAGRAQFTDDDYFRMIAAVVIAGAAVLFITVVWPGLASWIVHSARDLVEVIADKFGGGRTGRPIGAERPDIVKPGKFANHGDAGLNLSRGLASIYFGVVLYTGAFIAEIVRGGILAVPKGQTEAANAIGLRRSTTLRHVILPQALRVILPPLGNQYLNLTKNTSLAIAVGYSDVVQVGQTLYNQTGRTLEVVSLWMLFYLACSLTISVVVNFFNVRLRIVER